MNLVGKPLARQAFKPLLTLPFSNLANPIIGEKFGSNEEAVTEKTAIL